MVKKVDASRVVTLSKLCKKAQFITRCIGVFGLPFCCLGTVCLLEDNEMEFDYLFKVVDMYSEEVLNKLAPLVNKEHVLFLRACKEVNEGMERLRRNSFSFDNAECELEMEEIRETPTALDERANLIAKPSLAEVTIYPNVTLLDAVRVGMPSVGCVICLSQYGEYRIKSVNDKERYLGMVYKRYIELGGKVEVVVYGLAEYVAIIHNIGGDMSVRNGFGDIDGIEYFRLISGETQLHELVMSYKDKVCI